MKRFSFKVEEFVVDYISLILVHSCHVQCFNYGLHLNVSESNCWQLAWCSNWSSSHRNFWQYEHLKILPPRGERINRSAYAFTNISICLFYQKSTLFNTSEIEPWCFKTRENDHVWFNLICIHRTSLHTCICMKNLQMIMQMVAEY